MREYPALCRRAQDGGRPYEEFLHELLEAEVISRRQSTARRLLREARLPDVKTLDQVDWQALKGVAKPVPRRVTTKPITAPPPRKPAAEKRRTKPTGPSPINPTGGGSVLERRLAQN